MSMYGANPEQLSGLGDTFVAQVEVVEGIIATVNGVLESTLWQGPAKQHLADLWHGEFQQTFRSVNESFTNAGRDCKARAEELRRVMS